MTDTNERTIDIQGLQIITWEDNDFLYFEGLSLNTIILPKQRKSLDAIAAIIGERLKAIRREEAIAKRRPGRKAGQTVEKTKPRMPKLTVEQLRAATEHYLTHLTACARQEIEPVDFAIWCNDFRFGEAKKFESDPWDRDSISSDLYQRRYETYVEPINAEKVTSSWNLRTGKGEKYQEGK